MKRHEPFMVGNGANLRRSKMHLDFQRREITSQKEREETHREIAEKALEVATEKATEKELALEGRKFLDRESLNRDDHGPDWKAPESRMDLFRSISLAHPDWPIAEIDKLSTMMWERYELTRKALMDGLAMGRDLRERAEHGVGWWWESLQSLTPDERGMVLEHVRRIVTK